MAQGRPNPRVQSVKRRHPNLIPTKPSTNPSNSDRGIAVGARAAAWTACVSCIIRSSLSSWFTPCIVAAPSNATCALAISPCTETASQAESVVGGGDQKWNSVITPEVRKRVLTVTDGGLSDGRGWGFRALGGRHHHANMVPLPRALVLLSKNTQPIP